MKVWDFEVDLEDLNSIKSVLSNLIEKYDSLIINDGGGFTFQFGQMDGDKMKYHGERGLSYTCFPFFEAACQHEELQADAQHFLQLLTETNDGQELWDRSTWSDEHPMGLYASFALILSNKKYVQTHIELFRTFHRDHIFDTEQVFVEQFIHQWGYCDELLHLIAARLLSIQNSSSFWHFDELLGGILSPLIDDVEERNKFYNYLLKDSFEMDYRFQDLPGEAIYGELLKGINEHINEELNEPDHFLELLSKYDFWSIKKFEFEVCKVDRFFRDENDTSLSDRIKINSRRNLANPTIYQNSALNVQVSIPMGFQVLDDPENKLLPRTWKDDVLHISDHRESGQIQFMNFDNKDSTPKMTRSVGRIIVMLSPIEYESAEAFFAKAEADGEAYLKSIEGRGVRTDYNYNYHSMETPEGFDGYQSVEQVFYKAPKNVKITGRLRTHMFLINQRLLSLYFDLLIKEDEILETVESVRNESVKNWISPDS